MSSLFLPRRPQGRMGIIQFFSKRIGTFEPSVIQVIQEIFEKLTILPDWGITNLVLIPKVAHLEMINRFQLISLCNTLYNLVS